MSLRAGDRLGPYEILGAIGAGGMGEVYRGRDTRLDRTVAIKVLPDAVAQDPERLARFEREAKTLAALNHPQIAQIYGLEGSALAMEFVEGEDLSTRIARGPMPVDDALDVAGDVALALEAAHEIGIVHRDLKASNIRLRQDGAVKILDFGLAKALAPPIDTFSAESMPTITTPAGMTSQGVVLGTAAYMSPEQARGKPVDKRADIWAFGVVLYEMVTGRLPFEGETVTESLAAVIKSEPDWTGIPVQLHRLLRSCLEKDPKKRLRDIGDWRRQLDDPATAQNRAAKKTWLPWAVSAAVAIGAGILALTHFRETTPAAPPIAFQIPPPVKNTFETSMAVSPDGRRVAFTAKDADNVDRVWVRDFGSLESRPVAGTEGARNVGWSHDGRSVAFAVGRSLRRTAVDGGPPLTIYEAESVESLGSAAWSPMGVLVVGGYRAGAMRLMPESGGAVRPLTTVDTSRQELAHGIPAFLPDGRRFLYLRVANDPNSSGLFVGAIDRKPEEQDRTRLLASSHAVYTSAEGALGALLYLRQATLVAHPFDPDRLAFVGEPVPVVEGVGNFGALGFFSAGAGVIAYRSGSRVSGGRESQLTWVDRSGKPTGVVGRPGSYDGISLSSDGTRAAVIQVGPSDTGLGNVDIWTVDLARGIPQRLTSHDSADRHPTWSPRGDQIVFMSMRSGSGDLNVVSSTGAGAEAAIFTSKTINVPTNWSSDGRFVLFHSYALGTPPDILLLPLTGERKPIAMAQTPFAESDARFSPDMKWISYSSNASGRSEIYVRPFNAASPASSPSAAIIVSKDGGSFVRWRRDSRELFFQTPDGKVAAVGLEIADGQIKPGVPVALFTLPRLAYWDVTGDGQRFLVTMPPAESGVAPINVLLNWSPR
jgi:serine/threonine protein kinase/Tol biopolymer transport system component